MKNVGKLQITTPSDREIAMTRVFDAPRRLVWDALTKPELVKRWLGVRGGWTLDVCEIDLQVGGRYRYVWRGPDQKIPSTIPGVAPVAMREMGMSGVYREVAAPGRLVATEVFDQSWYEGDALDTMVLVEKGGKTTLTTTVQYDSKAIRDAVLKSPMEKGVAEGYDKLDELLASQLTSETK